MFCFNCGAEMKEGDLFCPKCGTKQVKTYREVFMRNGLPEADFICNINRWFQYHPGVSHVRCTFDMNTSFGLLANKYALDRVELDYELLNGVNRYQYGLVKEESVSIVKGNVKEYMMRWKEEHPNVTVVSWSGGTHSRGTIGTVALGVGSANRMNVYILFRFPRQGQ